MKICALFLSLSLLFMAACSKAPEQSARNVRFYQSPMHPWITSPEPGKCTICGMALVPIYEGDAEIDSDLLAIHGSTREVIGISTVPVRQLPLTRTLRFSGIFEDNENQHRIIAAFYEGRIEAVYVEHNGQYFEKNQALASIYSPELLYAVREYQNAFRRNEASSIRASEQRLVQYGLSTGQLEGLRSMSGEIYSIDLLAPISGTIVSKTAYLGQFIKPGEALFEMGNLDRLWFHAEVYERDLAGVRLGQKAIITTPTVPGREFEGIVTFIDPNFDPASRSTKVRIEVDNPLSESDSQGLRYLLPHRAYAEADLLTELGETLVLPRTAVLRDGRRTVVYVEKSMETFEPRAVTTGRVGDEGIEILTGLEPGERVVANGNLFLDAEAQLRNLVAPASPTEIPPTLATPPEILEFLTSLAGMSAELAAEDSVAAVRSGQNLVKLASNITSTGIVSVDTAITELQALKSPPTGDDLARLKQTFLPFSQAGANLALLLRENGADPGVIVLECPMTATSFPGAPARARWVQASGGTRNPYLGAEMLECGEEVKP